MIYILQSTIETFQDIETKQQLLFSKYITLFAVVLNVTLQRTMEMSNFYLAYIADFNSFFTNENDDTRARTMLRGCIFNMKDFLPYA